MEIVTLICLVCVLSILLFILLVYLFSNLEDDDENDSLLMTSQSSKYDLALYHFNPVKRNRYSFDINQ